MTALLAIDPAQPGATDFSELHARMVPDPATLSDGQRRNRKYPTAREIRTWLTHYAMYGPSYRGHSAAEASAWREKLIDHAPLSAAQERARIKGYKLNRRFEITDKGRQYLTWLLRKMTAAPKTTSDYMRQYHRKSPPGLRWQAALCKRRRTLITEDAPDRLSDDPNTPAPPVMAACPFVEG